MNLLQKSMLKISQSYLNFNRLALTLFLCVTIMTSCTTTSSDEGTGVSPPVPSPLELGDVTTTPASGASSPYAAVTVTIEGSVIVISGIINLADARSETLTVSIADKKDPPTYTVEPASITIPATVLNPEGTAAATIRVENVEFVLTPAGEEPITYSVEVRLSEFVAPPVLLPSFAVADITITLSGGDTSPYAAATPTIEGNTIVISGITNREDALRSETLTVNIADTDTPADYMAEPSSVMIAADVLNPDGIGVVNAVVPGVAFVLTPAATRGTAVTFNVELRLDALAPLPPLEIADITIATGSHPAYSAAMVSSVMGNIITISGIKNKEDGFSADLMLTISSSYRVTDRGTTITGADNALILAGASLNPSGVASTTTAMDNEGLSFTVTSAGGQESASEKYYVHLVLGDLIQLKLLAGSTGDFASEVVLSEGTSSPGMTVSLKNCGVVTGSPSHEVQVGGSVSTAYTLTGTVNVYVSNSQTDFVLRRGTEILTFPLSVSSSCTTAGILGTGTSVSPYIIDNDRKLDLVARLVNANTGTYKSAHYRVARRIDLGIADAPWSEASSGSGFAPIGTSMDTNFAGTFDCEANDIVNLYVNRGDTANIGLFGFVSGATIRNCALTVVRVRGSESVGGLVGRNNNSTISNSYVTGGDIIGYGSVGGLVGLNENNSVIDKSYATVPITGINRPGTPSSKLGGLVGSSTNAAISNSYATGSISSGSTLVGGLVGESDTSTIGNSYAIGSVGGSSSVGGLIGMDPGAASTISASYWNTESTGQSTSAGGTGQTTMELQSATSTSYSGWLDTIWEFAPDNQYPRLRTVACANRQYITPVPTTCTGL